MKIDWGKALESACEELDTYEGHISDVAIRCFLEGLARNVRKQKQDSGEYEHIHDGIRWVLVERGSKEEEEAIASRARHELQTSRRKG